MRDGKNVKVEKMKILFHWKGLPIGDDCLGCVGFVFGGGGVIDFDYVAIGIVGVLGEIVCIDAAGFYIVCGNELT